MTPTAGGRVRSAIAILSVMVLAGWPAAGTPFRGDQALFAIFARELAAGAVLYRDYWDVTNPGIYAFYTAAGACLGFTEDGIHLFEWLYWLAFVAAVSEIVRRAYGLTRWPLAPAVLVGIGYFWPACSDPSQLTKVEGLVAFPLVVAIWAASRRTPRAAGLAGVAGGVVLAFKLLFGVCLAVGWGYLLYVVVRERGWRAAAEWVAFLALGVAAVLGAVCGYFAAHDALTPMLRTLFVDSRGMRAAAEPAGFDRLAGTVRWGMELYSAVFAAVVLGSWCRLRQGRDPFVVALWLVIGASASVILVQTWSWWTYHVLLPGVPTCVLAAYTWPAIWQRVSPHLTRREGVVLLACVLLALAPTCGHGANAYLRLLRHGGGFSAAGRAAARFAAGQAYREARELAAWATRPDAPTGAILVIGDPLVYWEATRRPAVAISGWSVELYHQELRNRLIEQVRRAKPVAVFVAGSPHGYDRLVQNRYPELQQILDTEYAAVERHDRGTWYQLREPAPHRAFP
ncbi:hypothetical protein [Limnoglobus roseus]|uniref:Glycosyltransferase RgtA/B/C/D-like domain-containing protein n=1 Tax=Limnoglobus roseus TaxID=2598579 RepID=A0A5C1A7C3_9BACT|nr:hypothetical protein [Limnoglobus roseus]QEL13732.1 hypothetical protein PX52LOC_00590 [Limnoglobus roseus]